MTRPLPAAATLYSPHPCGEPYGQHPLQTSAILPMFPRKRGKDPNLMRRAFLPLRSGGRCRLQPPERLRTAELARRASARDGASQADGGNRG